MKPIFDFSDGDFCTDNGGTIIDSSGNLMQDMGGNMALDLQTGELHIMGGCDSENSLFDDED